MKINHPKKRFGPIAKRGLPAHFIVGGKLNASELQAMRSAMKVTGIATQSLFVAYAVRSFVKANGIDIPDHDPHQQSLLPGV